MTDRVHGYDERTISEMMQQRGAVVLCGGKSTRMGLDKATLPIGSEWMLQRVVRIVSQVVPLDRIVVVAAQGQAIPPLEPMVTLVRDIIPDCGPLGGLATGLRSIPSNTDAVYVTSCDAPLLVPRFIEQMFDQLGDHDAAVPSDGQFLYSLAAVYRPQVAETVEGFIHEKRLQMRSLFHAVKTNFVPTEELRRVDPDLVSLINLNHQVEYEAALARLHLADFNRSTFDS